MKDSTKRTIRTVIQVVLAVCGVAAAVLAVPGLAIPGVGAVTLAKFGVAIAALTAVVTKVQNVLEDTGTIPAVTYSSVPVEAPLVPVGEDLGEPSEGGSVVEAP